MEAAERVAAERWDDRLAGARMAEGVARDELRAFVADNFVALAAEFIAAVRSRRG